MTTIQYVTALAENDSVNYLQRSISRLQDWLYSGKCLNGIGTVEEIRIKTQQLNKITGGG